MSDPIHETPTEPQLEQRHRAAVRQVTTMVKWLLYLVFVVLAFAVLSYLGPVLTPILVAGGIAYLLDPAVERLEANGLQRVWAVTFLLLAFLGSIAAVIVFMAPLVAEDVADFVNELPTMVENGANWAAANVGYEIPEHWQDYLASEEMQSLLQEVVGPASALALAAVGGFFTILGTLVELLLIPVFAFYFLLDWNHLLGRMRKMVPPRHRGAVVEIVIDIDRVVSAWIRGQFTVTAILAVLYAIAFYFLEVPLAIPVGVFVGLLTLVPFLGTFVGAGITIALLILDWQGFGQLAGVGVVFIALHLLEAAVLTPKIVGKKVGLGESGALFAVLAGGQLLGLAGVLLAVPIAASIAVLIRRLYAGYERSQFFGASDKDRSIKKSEEEVLREMVSHSPAAQAVLIGSIDAPTVAPLAEVMEEAQAAADAAKEAEDGDEPVAKPAAKSEEEEGS